MNRKHGPCMMCGETVGRAATEQARIFGSDVWIWMCGPCAKLERAETARIMALSELTEDEDEGGGA